MTHPKLTAETDLDSLKAPVVAERESLAKRAGVETDYSELAKSVNAVASAQGVYFVKYAYVTALRGGATHQEAYAHVVQQHVFTGPQDTWSGRANDARRAFYDGVLDVVRDMRYWR